jgi:hypothetical protein
MDLKEIKKALAIAEMRLTQKISEREKINLDVLRLDAAVKGLRTMLVNEEKATADAIVNKLANSPLAWTNAISTILFNSPVPLRATDIRKSLADMGYHINQNALKPIYVVIGRLIKAGKVRVVAPGLFEAVRECYGPSPIVARDDSW